MSEADPHASADPLEKLGAAERVNYATGVLLDAEDFRDEQSYHRGRLAALLRALGGFGTLAGLRVRPPAQSDGEREVTVDPGIAIDRFGRLVELREPWCIRIARWISAQPTSRLRAAVQTDGVMFVDVFMTAQDCRRGKTPGFASGPFDATDAVVPSRIAETPALDLIIRAEAGTPPLPQNFWPEADADAATRLQAVIGSWGEPADVGTSGALAPLQEHVESQDPSAILLARVTCPLNVPPEPDGRPTLDLLRPVTVDNGGRPFVFLPGKWLGRAFVAEPLVQP